MPPAAGGASPQQPSEGRTKWACGVESTPRKSQETPPAWPHGNRCRSVRAGRWRDGPAAGAWRAVAWLTVQAVDAISLACQNATSRVLEDTQCVTRQRGLRGPEGVKVQTCADRLCTTSWRQKDVSVSGSTWGLGVVPRAGAAGVLGPRSRPLLPSLDPAACLMPHGVTTNVGLCFDRLSVLVVVVV